MPARQSDQESAEAPPAWFVLVSQVPDLKQDVVKNIVDLRFVTNYSQNDRAKPDVSLREFPNVRNEASRISVQRHSLTRISDSHDKCA